MSLVSELIEEHTKADLRRLARASIPRGASKRVVAEIVAAERHSAEIMGHRGIDELPLGSYVKYDGSWWTVVDKNPRKHEVEARKLGGDKRIVVNAALQGINVFEDGEQVASMQRMRVGTPP